MLSLYNVGSSFDGRSEVSFSVTVNIDFTYTCFLRTKEINHRSCAILRGLPPTLNSGTKCLTHVQCHYSLQLLLIVAKLCLLLDKLASSHHCFGNPEQMFLKLPNVRNGRMMDHSSKTICVCIMYMYVCLLHTIIVYTGTEVVAVVDTVLNGSPTLYHTSCDVIVEPGRKRCSPCTKHRKALASMATRASRPSCRDHTHPSSHTTYAVLHTPEKNERLRRLHSEARKAKHQVKRLQHKLADSLRDNATEVDEVLDRDLREIISDNDANIKAMYPEGSFRRLFWEQQLKATMLHNTRSMKWHPLFIKWCLYLRHLSGKSYEMLRESGCIYLPSQRTLRDYTHFIPSHIGFSAEVDQQLLSSIDLSMERNRYVSLVMDEMHISGVTQVIGFVNLGETNNHLLQFESALSGNSTDPPLATSMLVFMVRGLFCRLNFPYAQFACHTLTGELLADPLWEAVSRLERQGIRVLALTCDGASTNRRLWKMHGAEEGQAFVYKVPNVFATEAPRPLFFISDPPHLIKTARNCWWNPKRSLWVSNFPSSFTIINFY